MNPSLRTRLSVQKAAHLLGMNVIVMNIDKEGWALETMEGAVMNGSKVEHIKDAAAMMGIYCDIIGIRCFPSLANKAEDYSEHILLQFMRYSKTPLISLESATLHPLQSLADMITIEEHKMSASPKVVLTWAPHIKPLPQAVANSFSEWALKCKYDLTIAHPEGYALSEDFTRGAHITTNQTEALENADFVYVKNWSSFSDYGKVIPVKEDWQLSKEKLLVTNSAKIMHCLPVRRNLELSDELLDSPDSLIHEQANNRVFSAQIVLKKMLEGIVTTAKFNQSEIHHA
jgi:N-succinyl-L-ornithine transcarbamylase